MPLTRAEFETLTRDLLMRTRLTTQQVLRQAGLTWEQVDRVLLVGGSTHMPMTGADARGADRQGSRTTRWPSARWWPAGRPSTPASWRPQRRRRPGHARRRGAASCSARWSRSTSTPTAWASRSSSARRAHQRHPHPQEHAAADGRQPGLPHDASRTSSGCASRCCRARRTQADACISIGECWIEGLPPNLPKRSPIQVRCGVGSNGLIDVMALDMTSGKMARTVIHRASGPVRRGDRPRGGVRPRVADSVGQAFQLRLSRLQIGSLLSL